MSPTSSFYPKGIKLEEVKGSDILLAIEVALTSLAYDRGLKAQLYARHGFNELWVIDAARRVTFVHHRPQGEGWGSVTERGPDEALTVAALPDFSIRLATI